MGDCLPLRWGSAPHYASILCGAMPPYCVELSFRTAWSYPSVLYGAMHPYCVELCFPVVWSYASVLRGTMRPYCVGLCTHTVWAYAPVLYGAVCPCRQKPEALRSQSYRVFPSHRAVYASYPAPKQGPHYPYFRTSSSF